MSRRIQVVAALVSVLVACKTGQGGIRFSPDSLNGQAWPSELNERQYFKGAGVYYRNLSGLVGHVLYPKKVNGVCPESYTSADLSMEQYLLPGTKIDPDTTAVERYSDRIDGKASVDVTVLTFASKLAANQAADVIVADTTTLIAPDAAIDIERLKTSVQQKLEKDDCQPYLIRGAMVTTITYRTATEVQADATVSGAAFGANGKVYNSARKYSLDFKLGVTVLPVRFGKDIAPEGGERPTALKGLAVPEAGFPAR
jgi:hypothetical protein